MLKSAAVVILVITATRLRLLQLAVIERVYRDIATQRVMVIAATKIMMKVRFAPVVSAGSSLLQKVPTIRIAVKKSPAMIPVLMAFLIPKHLVVNKDIQI